MISVFLVIASGFCVIFTTLNYVMASRNDRSFDHSNNHLPLKHYTELNVAEHEKTIFSQGWSENGNDVTFLPEWLRDFLWGYMPFAPLLLIIIALLGKYPRPESGRKCCDRLLKMASKACIRKVNNPRWAKRQLEKMKREETQRNLARSKEWPEDISQWLIEKRFEDVDWKTTNVPALPEPCRIKLFLNTPSPIHPKIDPKPNEFLSEVFVVDDFDRSILNSDPHLLDVRACPAATLGFDTILAVLSNEFGNPRVKSNSAGFWIIGKGVRSTAILIQYMKGVKSILIHLRCGGSRGGDLCCEVGKMIKDIVDISSPL